MSNKVKYAHGKLVKDAMHDSDDAALYDMVLHYENGDEGYVPLMLPMHEAMRAVTHLYGVSEIHWDKSSLLLRSELKAAKRSMIKEAMNPMREMPQIRKGGIQWTTK